MRDVSADFPILAREVNGHRLVYLDSAATSQKPQVVIDATCDYYERYNANVHRGVHQLAEEATAAFEKARRMIAEFLGVPGGSHGAEGVVFTKNASEAVNLVAYSWGQAGVSEGDRILVTMMEHHSNIIPWMLLAERTGALLDFAAVDAEGRIDMADFSAKLTERTKLVAVTHSSNVLGTINPIDEITGLAHEADALCLIDGAQAAPHFPVNVAESGCDFYVATGHKMCGPTGIGVLWGKPELLDAMPPFLGGGEMIADVRTDGARWNKIPHKFEAGTPPIAEAIGLGVAIDYLRSVGMDEIREHEKALFSCAKAGLEDAFGDGITIHGPADPEVRGAAISFAFHDVHPHDLATILDQEGVAIRAGHHCAKPLMQCLGVGATARASFYLYNTEEDVDALVKALHVAGELFRVT